MPDFSMDPVSIDVGHLVRKNVASLYSSLVTRPTGQAVRMAIENVLAEEEAKTTLSVVDLSQVTIIDFSCADEVVAKLLIRYLDLKRPRDAFFVFRGIKELHRDPIEVVLERHGLAAVAETESGGYQLIGSTTWTEEEAWGLLEKARAVGAEEVDDLLASGKGKEALDNLVDRRLAFRHPTSGRYSALSAFL